MKIQINSSPVGFELQNEKTVSDVINSMYKWTQQRDLVFVEAKVDDQSYFIDEIPDISLQEVELINCQIQSKADIVISSLSEGIEYCKKALNFMENSIRDNHPDITQIEFMPGGIDWIIEVLTKVLQLLCLDINEVKYKDKSVMDYTERLEKFRNDVKNENNISSLVKLFDEGRVLFSSMNDIMKMLISSENMKSLIINSIESPDVLIHSLKEIKDRLPEQLKNLEEIAYSFQAGKDSIGSEKLQIFIDFIYSYSRTCCQAAPVFEINLRDVIVDGISLDEKNGEINSFLSEIVEVMENNDIISLTDILEYEIKPALENLEFYIDNLIKRIE